MKAPPNEKVYYKDGDYRVTSTRIITPLATYAVRNVASVGYSVQMPDNTLLSAGAVVGSLMFFAAFYVAVAVQSIPLFLLLATLSAGIVGLCLATIRRRLPTYLVTLTTSAGQLVAVSSGDHKLVDKLVRAIENAIAEQ